MAFAADVERFELARFGAVFFDDGRFLLAAFFFFFEAFFLATFLADGRFFLALAFLLVFFLAVDFFVEAFFLATRFFLAVDFFFEAFFAAFLAGFFLELLRFDEGRADAFATRFLRDGFFDAVFLPLGLLRAAAFFVGMEFASNGRLQKTRDYTEVEAERNTLQPSVFGSRAGSV